MPLIRKGKRRKYLLDDGSYADVYDVAEKVPCSTSLALNRLRTSTDPKYIFSPKYQTVGHAYCKIAKKKKPSIKKKEVISTNKCNQGGDLKMFFDPYWKLINDNI